jgi:hypothetical protein
VADVRDWLIQEALGDLRAIDGKFTRLGLGGVMRQVGIEL